MQKAPRYSLSFVNESQNFFINSILRGNALCFHALPLTRAAFSCRTVDNKTTLNYHSSEFDNTVEIPVSDLPKCQAEEVAYESLDYNGSTFLGGLEYGNCRDCKSQFREK